MSEWMDYYLMGGKIRIGKREAVFELLRKDSMLRPLLGHVSGELKALPAELARASEQDGFVTFDFSHVAERKLDGDPAVPLNELKQRYKGAISGILYFKGVYSMGMQNYFFKADLSADRIALYP